MKKSASEVNTAKQICLSNAEALLSMAERELGKGSDHICFHLALLALEEVGKSVILGMRYTIAHAGKEQMGSEVAMDDHIKKIFWALWSGFLSNEKHTPEEIEELRNLASNLHNDRLETLYTDPENPIDPKVRMDTEGATKLIKLTRARLEYAKVTSDVHEFNDEELKDIAWFFSAQEDPEQRKLIFSHTSIEKFKESGSGRDWIKWLHDIHKKHREDMMKLAQEEISRKKPVGAEKDEPKYKMRLRIQSASHAIRDSAFDDWNARVNDIKMHRSSRKERPTWSKDELIIDLIFRKDMPPAALWEGGYNYAKTVVNVINIATCGLFWWNLPKDLEKFYEEIIDLEPARNGASLIIAPSKRLMIDWNGGGRNTMVLTKDDVVEIAKVDVFIANHISQLSDFMGPYSMGLTFVSKTDIHLRLEANAFEQFFIALKNAMLSFGDWDGVSDIRDAIRKIMPTFSEGGAEQMESVLEMAMKLNPMADMTHNITLTEVITMKMYCDFYIRLKAKYHFEELAKVEKDSDSASQGIPFSPETPG